MDTRILDGQELIRLVSGGAANLRVNAKIVDDLNVFPIPDGDTGENMSMTISGGLSSIGTSCETSIGKVSEQLADGMLMSARGNSGVILSQLFAGIAKGLNGKEYATVDDISEALREGVKSAYAAVINPTEGTILTVAREAMEYSVSRVNESSTLSSFAADYIKELRESLDRTPELLKTLKDAGVIDSGGAGLYYIVDGIIRTANGESIADEVILPSKGSTAPDTDLFSRFTEDSEMKFGYCTEVLIRLQRSKIDIDAFSVEKFTDHLSSLGDSIVSFKTGSIVKLHIHTMDPGTILTYCRGFGEFLTVKIENMTLQHNETIVKNSFGEKPKQEKKDFAMVTVATGEGIKQTFEQLGADVVIDGGQGKNPSTEDFISAFEKVNAKTVFVLPNNGNIIMAAKQAAELYSDSEVIVIESKSIGDGYAALTMLSYDSGDAEAIKEELTEAMHGTITGMVTSSIRTANIDGVDIHEHDYIGFTDKTMLASDPDKVNTAMSLLEKMNAEKHEFLIAIYGDGATKEETGAFRKQVEKKYPHTEIYEIDGGQKVYDFLLILQ